MKLLQKKIIAARRKHVTGPSCDTYDIAAFGIKALQAMLSDVLTPLTKLDHDIGPCKIEAMTYQECVEDLRAVALYYKAENFEGNVNMLIGLDSALAARVTSQALKVDDVLSNDYAPSQLDLILCRDIAHSIVSTFTPYFSDMASELNEVVSLSDLDFSRSQARQMGELVLIKIAMTNAAAQTENLAKAKTKSIKSESASKAAKKKPRALPSLAAYHITILLPKLNFQIWAKDNQPNDVSVEDRPVIDSTDPWYHHLKKSLPATHVNMRVVVETIDMTVAECTRLHIGQVLQLPGISLDTLAVEVDADAMPVGKEISSVEGNLPTSNPRVELTKARLGVYKSRRAVKLANDISEEFFYDLLTSIDV